MTSAAAKPRKCPSCGRTVEIRRGHKYCDACKPLRKLMSDRKTAHKYRQTEKFQATTAVRLEKGRRP